jgi:hypothetical protein
VARSVPRNRTVRYGKEPEHDKKEPASFGMQDCSSASSGNPYPGENAGTIRPEPFTLAEYTGQLYGSETQTPLSMIQRDTSPYERNGNVGLRNSRDAVSSRKRDRDTYPLLLEGTGGNWRSNHATRANTSAYENDGRALIIEQTLFPSAMFRSTHQEIVGFPTASACQLLGRWFHLAARPPSIERNPLLHFSRA